MPNDESGTEGPWPGFSVGQTEYFAADEANELCRTVVETYQRLKDIQGEIVPEFYASVLHDPQLGFQYPLELSSFELIPGILVEYIDGFILADIARHAPRDSWQQIGSDACAAVNNFSRHDVLNWDTRLTNTIIKTNKDRNGTVEYTFCNRPGVYAAPGARRN